MYQNHREHQWRCIVKGCNGRFHTIKSHKEEEMIDRPSSHSCESVTREEFLCKRAITRMKDRVKTELHVDPSKIYTEEQERLVRVDKVPRSQVGLYIRKYQSYKSTFLKLRHGLKPQLPQTLFDLNFEGDNFKYSQTTDEEPFLRHHSKNEDNHLLMFASNEGLKLLST